MFRISVVFLWRQSNTKRICSPSSFSSLDLTTAWGMSFPAIRMLLLVEQTVSTISSTISMASIKELGLKVGGQAYAIIKATSVMVGVDD